jgi:hypothetical protein
MTIFNKKAGNGEKILIFVEKNANFLTFLLRKWKILVKVFGQKTGKQGSNPRSAQKIRGTGDPRPVSIEH